MHERTRWSQEPATVGAIICLACFVVAGVGVWLGLWGTDWSSVSGARFAAWGSEHWLGTNLIGQDVFARALHSTGTALEVGLIVGIPATLLGALLGATAALYRDRWPDAAVNWILAVTDTLPFYLLVIALAFALNGAPVAMYLAMILVLWTPTARIVRAYLSGVVHEPFFLATRGLGASDSRLLLVHLLPNALPLLTTQFALTFVAAIKAEVVLSFLGLGQKDGVSWGIMIAESAQEIVVGEYNNFFAAAGGMFLLLLSLNILADRVQPAIDPRQVALNA